MIHHHLPQRRLAQPLRLREPIRRSRLQIIGVVVAMHMRHSHSLAALRRLPQHVIDIRLPERPIVEPIVAHPPVHHRTLRRRNLQRRVRIEQRHHYRESLVARPDHPHSPIRLRHILHQPVDRVVRIGRIIGPARVVARLHRRRRHQIRPLRPVLPAHILIHPDVPRLDEPLIAQRQGLDHARAVRSLRASRRVVRCPRQQDRRIFRAHRHHDHRAELHPVPHRDHHHALVIISPPVRSLEVLRQLIRRKILLLCYPAHRARHQHAHSAPPSNSSHESSFTRFLLGSNDVKKKNANSLPSARDRPETAV